jgi:hypothetical protein
MTSADDTETRWMHPAIWWLLLLFAPPVWLVLFGLRFLPEIIGAYAVLCVVWLAVFYFAS